MSLNSCNIIWSKESNGNFSLNKYNIIWSKGPNHDFYSRKGTETSSSKDEIMNIIKSANYIVFIRNGSSRNLTDLNFFSNNLDKLKNPIILITSDGDRPVPSSYDQSTICKILNSTNIIKWYTQNYDKSIIHPKISHYPIGFDLHTSKWLINNSIEEKIKYMVECRKKSPINKRISNKIFSDTHYSSLPSRKELYEKLKYNKNINFISQKLSFKEITKAYNRYNFVLSPRSAGLDCHRNWELFLAGVIVITKTSTLDDMFINNNLPVVILNDWNELNENLDNKLNYWYKNNINRTVIANIFPRLTFNYWIK